eukprot:5597565-Pyramimonas_sp.AAC.1
MLVILLTYNTPVVRFRARAIGAPLFTFYIGHNLYDFEMTNATTRSDIKLMIRRTAFLGERVIWDLHVGAEPNDVHP